MLDFIKKIWEAIPDSARKVAIQVIMVGAYSFVFVFLQTFTQDWQVSIALTAGVRAALIAIVQVLEAPKPATGAGKRVVLVPRQKLSEHL